MSMQRINEVRKWATIVNLDMIFNMWLLSYWFWANGFSLILSYVTLIMSVIFGYSAFKKNSFLNKKMIGFFIELDKKVVAWAIKKLKTDPSNKLARSFCPLSMQPRTDS